MTTIIVVITDSVVDLDNGFLKGVASVDEIINLILHMDIETLLRGVVLAVSSFPARHRLHEVGILELLDKGVACVMTSLFAVNYGIVSRMVLCFATSSSSVSCKKSTLKRMLTI